MSTDTSPEGFITPETFAPYGRVIEIYLPRTRLMPELAIPDTHVPYRTGSGRFLIPIEDSLVAFNMVAHIAEADNSSESAMGRLCQYLSSQQAKGLFVFREVSGCWDLPIPGDGQDYDSERRARYPLSPDDNTVIQRKSYAAFIDETVMVSRFDVVDHLCRRHSCLNPYHLEVVDIGNNTRRGNADRRVEAGMHDLFTHTEEEITFRALLKRAKELRG